MIRRILDYLFKNPQVNNNGIHRLSDTTYVVTSNTSNTSNNSNFPKDILEQYPYFFNFKSKHTVLLPNVLIKQIMNLYLQYYFPYTESIRIDRNDKSNPNSIFQMVFRYSVVSKDWAFHIIPNLSYPSVKILNEEELIYICLLKNKGVVKQSAIKLNSIELCLFGNNKSTPLSGLSVSKILKSLLGYYCKFHTIKISLVDSSTNVWTSDIKDPLTEFLLSSEVEVLNFANSSDFFHDNKKMSDEAIYFEYVPIRLLNCIDSKELIKLDKLTWLNISSQGLNTVLGKEFSFMDLLNLTYLNISSNKLDSEMAGLLAHYIVHPANSLIELNLSCNNLRGEGINVISSCIESCDRRLPLQSLNISENLIGDDGAEGICTLISSPNLTITSLDISTNPLTEIGLSQVFKSLGYRLSTLQSLGVSNLNPHAWDEFSVYLSSTSKLKTLYLKSLQFQDVNNTNGDKLFESLKLNNTITKLDLSSTIIESNYHRDLLFSYIEKSKILRVLLVSSCFLTLSLSESHISSLFSNKSIQELDLSLNSIGERTSNSIGRYLLYNNSIFKLNLSHNLIGQIGFVTIFKSLEKNSTLVDLNLCYNRITAIQKNLMCDIKHLHSLNISHNYIGYSSMETILLELKSNTSLRSLDVSFNQANITSNQLDEFFKVNKTLMKLLHYTPVDAYGKVLLSTTQAIIHREIPNNTVLCK